MERLQKVIANLGYCSRRKAEELIEKGKVTVNGETVIELGTKVSKSDIIEVEGLVLSKEKNYEYYLLNKPRGVVSTTSDDKGRKTVIDLIDTNTRIYPVGRLDYDTTGLILLTNDGALTKKLTHPSSKIEKTYIAKIDGIIKGEQINALKNGVVIDEKKVYASRVKLKKIDSTNNTSLVQITIHEGRNHQVKKMFEAVGFHVLKLKRESEGIFTLDGLKCGEYRKLSPKEVSIIYSLKNKR